MTDPQSGLPKEEPKAESDIVRWIPFVPLGAVLIVFCVYVIYAAILTQVT
jgi:hypothetical protein